MEILLTFKGTAGNFYVDTDSLGNHTQLYATPHKHIASITGQGGKLGGVPENEANAKLFAASKDMLKALIEIIEYEDRGRAKGEPRIADKFYNQAKEAVKKAL